MKTNQDRSGRFAFGVDPDRYDRGRPRFSGRVVRWALSKSGFAAGDHVLEIGAGSGQLTGELLRSGAAVTALEPSDGLADLLRRRHADGARGNVEVHGVTFEQFESSERFALVTAANAFHWIDPDVSYRKAAALLAPAGRLCLFWHFPILADAACQLQVNAMVRQHGFGGLARDPTDYEGVLHQLLAEGRAEIDASGRFRCGHWLLEPVEVRSSVRDYLDLLATLASARDLTPVRSSLSRLVFDDVEDIELVVYEYVCVASPLVDQTD